MTLIHKIGAAILAALLLFGAGWFSRGKEIQTVQLPPQVVTKTETQVQTKVVDHVVTKVVTVTKKEPSGAVTTTVTKETTADQTKDKGREVSSDKVAAQPVGTSKPANWSVGASWTPRLSPAAEYPTEVEVSRRVLGPAWVGAGYDWSHREVKVGLRVEF